MKKLVFTALAVVAFSGAGFAKNNLNSKLANKTIVFNCEGFAIRMTEAIEELEEECMSGEDYTTSISFWTDWCETTKGLK